jgi:hypothetical protein
MTYRACPCSTYYGKGEFSAPSSQWKIEMTYFEKRV